MIILQAFSVVIMDLSLSGINGLLYCFGNIFIFANKTGAGEVLSVVCSVLHFCFLSQHETQCGGGCVGGAGWVVTMRLWCPWSCPVPTLALAPRTTLGQPLR